MQGVNVIYKLIFNDRLKNRTPPYYYIGSKLNCGIKDNVIIDSRGKPYYSSCYQDRFIESISKEIPSVEIIEIVEDASSVLSCERHHQLSVTAVKNEDYFNLIYAGDGFGTMGKRTDKAKSNMKAANYMNQNNHRPWKTSRADRFIWSKSDIIYEVFLMLHEDIRYNNNVGWRRVKSNLDFSVSDCTIKSIIKYFKSDWVPLLDEEFIALKLQYK